MNTAEKGNLGESKAIADLISQGYEVIIPFSSNLPFDLVIYKNNKFYRIQVKYRSIANGILQVICRRTTVTSKQQKHRSIKKDEVDFICVYCPETDKCYYINYTEVTNYTFYLRIYKPRQKNKKIRFAKDYEKLTLPP